MNQHLIRSEIQPRLRSRRRAERLLLALLAVGSVLIQGWVACGAAALPENRYLLIVETSLATADRVEGISKALDQAFASRMKGQLHAGDSIGLWTFNNDLSAGKFPLQTWSPGKTNEITAAVLKHVREQHYVKRPLLDCVMPALQRLIADSDFLTVVLVTSGQSPLRGTPFDQAINEIHKDWAQKQQEAHMPMLTVLRATKGKILDYRISASPFPIDLPRLPPELDTHIVAEKSKTPAVSPSDPVKTQPLAIGQPLIISGKKPAPLPVPKGPPAVQPVPAVSAGQTASLPSTNQVSLSERAVTVSTPTNPPALVAASTAATPTTNALTAQAPAEVPHTGGVAAATAPLPPLASPPAAPTMTAEKTPAASATPTLAPGTGPGAQVQSATFAPEPPPQTTTPAQVVIHAAPRPVPAVPAGFRLVQKIMILVGGSLLLALAAVLWVAVRSSKRSHQHTSLITESMGPGGP